MECCDYQIVTSTGPTSLPIHRNAIKQHCRLGLDVTEDDKLIDDYIREATIALEKDTQRALVMQTRKMYMEQFPIGEDCIAIPACPVYAIDSITYVDYSGETQTWSSSSYIVNTADEPAEVAYVFGGMWPSAREQEKSITVTMKSGYVVPFSVNPTTNVFTLTNYTPTNGDIWRVTNSGGTLPGGLSENTDYYVVNASGSTCKLSTTAGGSAVDVTTTGTGLNFFGELDPRARQAIYMRVAGMVLDREGADYSKIIEGYWSRVYSLRYGGW